MYLEKNDINICSIRVFYMSYGYDFIAQYYKGIVTNSHILVCIITFPL